MQQKTQRHPPQPPYPGIMNGCLQTMSHCRPQTLLLAEVLGNHTLRVGLHMAELVKVGAGLPPELGFESVG